VFTARYENLDIEIKFKSFSQLFVVIDVIEILEIVFFLVIPPGARISPPVQTGPVGQPTSYLINVY